MELNLSRLTWPILIVTCLAILIALALLGAVVTTSQADEPQLISPQRWTAARLARQAQAEAQALMHDASQLLTLLEADQPEPVAAMLLAQRLYAAHREGTSATGSARQALIIAAEISARYAVGELPRQNAINTFNQALNRIEPLLQPAEKSPNPRQENHMLFTPLVQRGRPQQPLPNRSTLRIPLPLN